MEMDVWDEWASLNHLRDFALDLQGTARKEGSRKLDLVARSILTAVEATQVSGATDLLEESLIDLKKKTDAIDATPITGVMKEFGMI